ncbi:hypothetical protein ACWGK7_03465 [Sphingomonas aurantiaca]
MATKKKNGRGRTTIASAKIKKAVLREPVEQPTPELMKRAAFVLGPVKSEMGEVLGRAYRRRAIFETMADQGGISPDELDALRFYRATFDRCDRSPMRSCLDVDGNGVMRADGYTPRSIIDAKKRLRLCEAGLGSALSTMRAVALDDLSFSQIAIARFGCRIVRYEHVDAERRSRGDHREKIRPRSGRDREVVRREFQHGLLTLTDIVRSITTRAGVEELWVCPEDDGTATIRRGALAPNGLYRCWGDSEKIDAIMTTLRKVHGARLMFDTPQRARSAMDNADESRLERLDPEELAA